MTYEEMTALLSMVIDPGTGQPVPFAYHHWEEPPVPPYGVYLFPGTDNFGADNVAYFVISRANVELYVSQRSETLERALEAVLNGAELYWNKNSVYIESLRQHQVSYEFEV